MFLQRKLNEIPKTLFKKEFPRYNAVNPIIYRQFRFLHFISHFAFYGYL